MLSIGSQLKRPALTNGRCSAVLLDDASQLDALSALIKGIKELDRCSR
jgi:hypothetical protein